MRRTLSGTVASGRVCILAAIAVVLVAGATVLSQAPSRGGARTRESEQVIRVSVAKSRIIRTPWPVKRVAVTDPKIADVLVLTPQEVLLQGKVAGSTDLIMWGDGGKLRKAHVDVVVDIRALQAELKRLFPGTTVKVHQVKDVVVATGTLSRAEQVQGLHKLLEAHDLKYVDMTTLAGVHQVMIEVRVAEVSRRAMRALGLNALYTGNDFFGASLVGSSGGGAINPISIGPASGAPASGPPSVFTSDVTVSPSVTLFAGIPDWDLQLFLQALAENQYLRILAEPTLIASSGKEATFLAGGEFPIPVVQGSSTTGGGSTITIEYREFGVRLTFRPVVLGDGTIELYVAPEVSQLSDQGAVQIQGFQIPALLTRRASTTVRLKNRQMFAIAGLINRVTNATQSRLPGLGDLPVLGALFRSIRYTTEETDLVVLVRASLVEPLSSEAMPPSPGMTHLRPDDWELYALGWIEGKTLPKLSPIDMQDFVKLGLHRLKGPGAWADYGQRSAYSEAGISPQTVQPSAASR